VLDLPDESAGDLGASPDQVPSAEETNHSAAGVVFARAVVGPEVNRGVVDAEGQASLPLQAVLPALPPIEERSVDLAVGAEQILHVVRSAELGLRPH
jgi:hypothetical protein